MRGTDAPRISGQRGEFTPAEIEAFYVEWHEKFDPVDETLTAYETFCADVGCDPNQPESWVRWCEVTHTENA